jgi:hypothetical protein
MASNSKSNNKRSKSSAAAAAAYSAILHNSMVLYLFLVISLAYIIYYSYVQNFVLVVVFFLVGFLVSFFSKNMIVILFSALTLSFLINYVMGIRHHRGNMIEGMETASDEKSGGDDDEEMDDSKVAETVSEDIKNTSPDKKKLIKNIYKQTQDLIKTQNNIIENADKLKPFVAKISMISDKLSSLSS